MLWGTIFSNVVSVQHNELLYTYLLRIIVTKLKKEGIKRQRKYVLQPYPLEYAEYKLEVYYMLLRLSEYYKLFKGRPNENARILKQELLDTILTMHVTYGVLNT